MLIVIIIMVYAVLVKSNILTTFIKAVVKSILLLGSQIWVLNIRLVWTLGGFHNMLVIRMTVKQPCRWPNSSWEYPSRGGGMGRVGLVGVEVYINLSYNVVA